MKPDLQLTVREAAAAVCWQCRNNGDPVWIEGYEVHDGKQEVVWRQLRHPYAGGKLPCLAEGIWKKSEEVKL